jgi:hypothetical protein
MACEPRFIAAGHASIPTLPGNCQDVKESPPGVELTRTDRVVPVIRFSLAFRSRRSRPLASLTRWDRQTFQDCGSRGRGPFCPRRLRAIRAAARSVSGTPSHRDIGSARFPPSALGPIGYNERLL